MRSAKRRKGRRQSFDSDTGRFARRGARESKPLEEVNMRKLLCLSAVAAFAMAFAFVSVADAAPGGNGKGKKKTSAIAASA